MFFKNEASLVVCPGTLNGVRFLAPGHFACMCMGHHLRHAAVPSLLHAAGLWSDALVDGVFHKLAFCWLDAPQTVFDFTITTDKTVSKTYKVRAAAAPFLVQRIFGLFSQHSHSGLQRCAPGTTKLGTFVNHV